MRLVLRPGTILEFAALKLNLIPTPIVELLSGLGIGCLLISGVRTGVVAELARGDSTADELAAKLGLSSEPLNRMLDGLVVARYLDVRDDRYSLTRAARRWLDPASPTSVAGFMEFGQDLWETMGHLDASLRGEGSLDVHGVARDSERWFRYIHGQYEIARLVAPRVARSIPVDPGARLLLDLGGGHGWFAAEVCRRHAGLQATVIDLPGSAVVGREIIRERGMADRVSHVEGDVLTASLPSKADVVLCFNLIHHLSEDAIRDLFVRVRRSLRPGGALAVLEFFARQRGQRPSAEQALGLIFQLESGGRTYPRTDVMGWLTEAGFGNVRRRRMATLPGLTLLIAR